MVIFCRKDVITVVFSVDALLRVFEITVPSIFAVALFILAGKKEAGIKERDALQQRLDSFYIPFYQLYMRGLLGVSPLGNRSFEVSGKFLDLFMNNIHLMGSQSQALVQRYYVAYLNKLEADHGNPMFSISDTQKELDDTFNELTRLIQSEYIQICHKLKLPKPLALPV